MVRFPRDVKYVHFTLIVNHLLAGTTDDVLSNTQILTLHFTRLKEMFVKQIKYRCERVQERIKQCRRMNLSPKHWQFIHFQTMEWNILRSCNMTGSVGISGIIDGR